MPQRARPRAYQHGSPSVANSTLTIGKIAGAKPKRPRKTFGMPQAQGLAKDIGKAKGPGIYAKLNKVKKL